MISGSRLVKQIRQIHSVDTAQLFKKKNETAHDGLNRKLSKTEDKKKKYRIEKKNVAYIIYLY